MIASKIASKLKNYYLNNKTFRNFCQNYLTKINLDDERFDTVYNSYCDVSISNVDFIAFLNGLLNYNNLITELCTLYYNNVYYLAGQEAKKESIYKSLFYIATKPEFIGHFPIYNSCNFVPNDYLLQTIEKFCSIPISHKSLKYE